MKFPTYILSECLTRPLYRSKLIYRLILNKFYNKIFIYVLSYYNFYFTLIGVFVCGTPYYIFKKPIPNIIPKMIKCIFVSIFVPIIKFLNLKIIT